MLLFVFWDVKNYMTIALTQEAPVIVPAVFSNKIAKILTFFKAQSVVKHSFTVWLIWCVQSTWLSFSNPYVFCCSLLGLICYLNRLHLPFVMFCATCYQLYNVKNVENTHWGVLFLVCNSTKNNTPSWMFFTFLKLYKWYQIAQRIIFV